MHPSAGPLPLGPFLPALLPCPAALALRAPLGVWGAWSPLNLPSAAVCLGDYVPEAPREEEGLSLGAGGPTAAQTLLLLEGAAWEDPSQCPARLRLLLPLAS